MNQFSSRKSSRQTVNRYSEETGSVSFNFVSPNNWRCFAHNECPERAVECLGSSSDKRRTLGRFRASVTVPGRRAESGFHKLISIQQINLPISLSRSFPGTQCPICSVRTIYAPENLAFNIHADRGEGDKRPVTGQSSHGMDVFVRWTINFPFPVWKHFLPKGISERNRFFEQKENHRPMKSTVKNGPERRR